MTTETRTKREELADQIAHLVGWCPSRRNGSERERALMQLWRLWAMEIEDKGGRPTEHPTLTKEHIAQLATDYDNRPR